ncbi:CRAL-TRIO domain-containing protein [Obelidium mucronatum]|nr:CRAL-TRIO domain-containing protein [Obelidium mucronatum]
MDQVFLSSESDFAIALAALKTRVAANAETSSANISESLLKRTLWAKHNDLKSSESLLVAYAHWHMKNLGSSSARLNIKHVHAFLLTSILQVLPTKDRDGLPMVFMKPNEYFPAEVPWQQCVCALVYLLEVLTGQDETAAKYGFTFVCDMKNWGWQNFGLSYASQFFAVLSGRFPVRIRKFVLVNPPTIFPMVWKLIKPMMSADLASKFQFATSGTVGSLIELKNLPVDLGGQFVLESMADFVKERYEKEGFEYVVIDLGTVKWDTYKSL